MLDENILNTVSPYFFDLYERLPRGGPGNLESTLKAYRMMEDLPPRPELLDIGCGPGSQTLDLATHTDARIVAIDLHDPFVARLTQRVKEAGLEDRIEARAGNMFTVAQDHPHESKDVIWSEGALYFMGFENALNECFKILRPGGYLAASDGCWLVDDVPEEAKGFWGDEPYATGVPEHLEMIARSGFELVGHFTLPLEGWTVDFYGPLEKELDRLEKENAEVPEAMEVYLAQRQEMENLKKYNQYAGYEFFVMRKPREG